MEEFSSSQLSSIDSIQQAVDFSSGDFTATKALGSFINNNEFMKGFIDYVCHRNTSQTYVWQCLSAVSDQLGDTLYKNVKNYIDYTANVDTCKVQTLRSMMKELGFDYTIFDNIESVPREVLDLLNIVSIDKKYLLRSGVMQNAFIEDMLRLGIMTSADNAQLLSDYYDLNELSGKEDLSAYCKTAFQIDDSKYQEYVEHLFTMLLSGFCELPYNYADNIEDNKNYCIYKTIKLDPITNVIVDDSYSSSYDKQITDFISQHNVDIKFDYKKVVDDIDNGVDYIDNYQYPLSNLVQLEIDRRKSKLSNTELAKTSVGMQTTEEKNKTRYSYYRKQKVLEYINFINNKYFIDNAADISSTTYAIDPSYIEVLANGTNYVLSLHDNETTLNGNIIKKVAKSLAIAAQYICKLRGRLKFQVRKTYMKGTQNLLLFIINEYLIDYAKHKSQIIDFDKYEDADKSDISAVLSILAQHPFDRLGIIEYYDETQYYNLSTELTLSAQNNDLVNDRFWQKTTMTADDGISYKLNQIERFYQNVMLMKNKLSGIDELSEFLDTIFDVGADRSYVGNDDLFSTQLSAHNGRYADDVYAECMLLSDNWLSFNDYLVGRNYEYDDKTTVSDQISTVVDFISSYLLEEKLSDVSSVQEEYEPQLLGISTEFNKLDTQYYEFLSGDMNFYFIKSDCKHCYDETEEGIKTYRHDWYVGNPIYANEDGYLLYELQNFRRFLDAEGLPEKNIVNWPLVDTITTISNECARICAEYKTDVTEAIELCGLSGFYDINALTLDDELQNGYDYLDGRINRRFEFLQKNLENVRAQANQLRSDFNRVKENFAAAIASYDDKTLGISLGINTIYCVSKNSMSYGTFESDKAYIQFSYTNLAVVGNSEPSEEVAWIQYNNVLERYAYVTESMLTSTSDSGLYKAGNRPYDAIPIQAYNESDPIETRIDAFISYQDTPTAFSIGHYTDKYSGITTYSANEYYYGLRQEGPYAAAIQCKQNVEAIGNQIASVVKQIIEIGGDIDISGKRDIEDEINTVIEYISTNFNEGCFENDSLILLMRQLMSKIDVLKTQYEPYKAEFEAIRNDPIQASYLNGLTATQLTFASLAEHLEYAEVTDNKNRAELILTEEQFEDDLDDLYAEYSTIADKLQNLTYEWQYLDYRESGLPYRPYVDKSSGILEVGLSDATSFLVHPLTGDVAIKIADAELEVERIIGLVNDNLSPIKDEISSSLQEYKKFDVAVQERLDYLNIFNDVQYNQRNKMFLTYGGCDFCYYPYYNLQNLTHPSYQIHPFLWNFVAKDEASIDSLVKTFLGYKVDELAEKDIENTVDKYYGEFGQSVGEWLNPDIYDYSGYTTRYESSTHIGKVSNRKADIIDFEGAFYPPAVECLNKAIQKGKFNNCLASILDGVAYDIYANNSYFIARNPDLLQKNLTDLVDVSDNYDENNEVSSVSYDKDRCIYSTLSPQVEPYVVDFKLADYIDSYFKKHLVNATISAGIMHNFLTSLANDIEDTFYSKYYHHLPYMDEDNERQYIVDQLSTYYPMMSADVLAEHDLSDSYDIYKYGHDVNGNSYVLFKRYFNDDPTYKFKKNTVGQMWTRLKDQPFAFPLLNGRYPIANTSESRLPSLIVQLSVEQDPCKFYDFEISKDQKKLFLVSRAYGHGMDLSSSAVQNYENPWIIVCNTDQVIQENGQMLIDLIPLSSDDGECYVRSGANREYDPALSVVPTADSPISSYAFLGTYLKNNITTGLVYALKEYSISGTQLLNEIKVLQVFNTDSAVVNEAYTAIGKGLIVDPYDGQIVFAHDNGQLTFAYLKKKDLVKSAVTMLSSSVDLSSNTSGKAYDDPRSNEMNSHDIFISDVAVVKCQINGNELELQDADYLPSVTSKHNMNADMTWLPTYPGEDGELSIYLNKDLSSSVQSGLQIQLLGNSKNIDQQIAQVNDDVDPYADLMKLSDDFAFGRVYEDYKQHVDNTYRLFKSPTINTRVAEAEALLWTISLSSYGYSDKAIDTLKLIAYNSKTLGKNPYLIASIKTIATETPTEWFDIPGYNAEYSTENSREQKVQTSIDVAGIEVDVTGTYSKTKFLNRTDSNHLVGIKSMQMQFIPSLKQLNVKLNIDSAVGSLYAHVGKDEMNVLLYTTSDLQMFNYYHYLDAYGVVNVKDANMVIPSPLIGDHWKIIYGKPNLGKDIEKFARKYILDENGAERIISENELDKYNALSDVYVLQTNKRLSFKYSEEDVFPFDSENYYFPTLNIKYPKMLGDFVTSPSCQLEKAAQIVDISGTFDDSNLFILDLASPEISANFGRVEIEMSYDDVDCLEGFEKYTTFDDEKTISDDFNKFDVYDARAMHQVDFTEFGVEDKDEVNEIANEIFNNPAYYDTTSFLSALELSVNVRLSEKLSGEVVPFGLEQSTSKLLNSAAFDITSIDLTDLMKLYVNYKKTDNGIVLYFNYYNYINTPFVKMVDNKLYPDYIDNSYCRLGPNETGYVSIVVQLKYYVDNALNGIKNVMIATYKVTNMSDDKPKFVIEEVSKLKKGDLKTIHESPNVTMIVRDTIVELSNHQTEDQLSTYPDFNIYIDVETDRNLSVPYNIGVNYPYELARPTGNNGLGFVVDYSNAGYFDITVTDPSLQTVVLGLSTALSAQALSSFVNRYQVFIDKADAYGQNEQVANIMLLPGAIEIKNSKTKKLNNGKS